MPPLRKRVTWRLVLEEQVVELPFNPDERDVSTMAWYKAQLGPEGPRSGVEWMSQMDNVMREKLTAEKDPALRARLIAMFLRMDLLRGYCTPLSGTESDAEVKSFVARACKQGRVIRRQWTYDTGASRCTIGHEYLSASEIKSIERLPVPITFFTANGTTQCTQVAQCKVPHLGMRQCYVVPNCSPLVSVGEDVEDYGSIFYWDANGPVVETADGRTIRLDITSNDNTPMVPDDACSASVVRMETEHPTVTGRNGQPCAWATTHAVTGVTTQDANIPEGIQKACLNCQDLSSRLRFASKAGRDKSTRAIPKSAAPTRYDSDVRKMDSILSAQMDVTPGGDRNAIAQGRSAKAHWGGKAFNSEAGTEALLLDEPDETQPFFV